MDTNEIMTNDEVVEITEEFANVNSGRGFKVAIGIGLGVLVSVIAYKYVVKPMIIKLKAKKEMQGINNDVENLYTVEIESENEQKI